MDTALDSDTRVVIEDFCQAWNRGDAAAVAQTYAADGRLINPLGDSYDGREAVRDGYAEYFSGMLAGSTTEISIDEIRRLADGLFVVDGTQLVSGAPLPPLHITVVVRESNGKAEIVEFRPYAFLVVP
ncbi:SgcJ/EcaC family oxidoreductase [Antrihabitans stalactiti]|uniref:SgcJ/EcaC family oxidoreductase n=1 Tax=Antrihabitans stalactiti TaxID=2584121 RepID=A0A848KUF2_9NOCA|nr:SgcJ/EcaC family oxidoreductase [Antrihabitans stalactiti]NMN99157.1 SgcJ/EcaC family oxidoreductase [Antrihabitans stalactiti]